VNKIIKYILKYIEDILIFSGLILIVIATFLLSKIIGLYVLGLILFGLGIFFSRHPPIRSNKDKER
jgi:membrane-bound ClpP family serine protease